jgi:dTDP-4-dehydrorhamnose reductase
MEQLRRVAVIGASGQLGTELMKAIAAAGLEGVPLDQPAIEVTDPASVRRALEAAKADLVINTAAFHKVDQCEKEPGLTAAVNCDGALNVARACADTGAICAFISTDYIFGGFGATPLTEASVPSPLSVYGLTKALAERLVAEACPRHYIFRVSGLFGLAGAAGKGGNFIDTVLKLSAERDQLAFINDMFTSVTYAVDAARAMLEVGRRGLPFGTWQTVNAGAPSWYDVASFVAASVKARAKIGTQPMENFAFGAPRPRYSVMSVEKLASHGIVMPFWQDAVQRYLKEKGVL